jgi:hypothetical protein
LKQPSIPSRWMGTFQSRLDDGGGLPVPNKNEHLNAG